jgi:hypothetical protein
MADSSISKLSELTQALMRKTKDGELAWERSSMDKVYVTRLGPYTIQISEEPGENFDDIVIRLYDEKGDIVDTFSDVTFQGFNIEGYSGYFELMSELHKLASRQASGADKAVDDILRLLR